MATHLGGAIACALGAWPLIRRGRGFAGRCLALGLFAGSAVLLMLCSSLYHSLPVGTQGRDVAQRLDHAAIFLLIAGSFTPIHAIMFRGVMRWGMLAFIWGSAAAGVVLKSVFFESVPMMVGVAIYLALGWTGGVAIVTILVTRGLRLVSPLLLGGLAYTAGALCEFTGEPVLVEGVVGPHEVFHMAVLVGLGSMWLFMHRIGDKPFHVGSPARVRGARRAVSATAVGRAA